MQRGFSGVNAVEWVHRAWVSFLADFVILDKSALLSVCHLQNIQEGPGCWLILLRLWKAWRLWEGVGSRSQHTVIGTEPTVRRAISRRRKGYLPGSSHTRVDDKGLSLLGFSITFLPICTCRRMTAQGLSGCRECRWSLAE